MSTSPIKFNALALNKISFGTSPIKLPAESKIKPSTAQKQMIADL